jgi:hypothetical protein
MNNLEEGNPNSISARWPNGRIHPREDGEGERSKIDRNKREATEGLDSRCYRICGKRRHAF